MTLRAWIVSQKAYGVVGAHRFTAETDIVKPAAMSKEEIDRDEDVITLCSHHATREKAEEAARGFYARKDLAFGVAFVYEEVLDWYVRQDGLAEWEMIESTREEVEES